MSAPVTKQGAPRKNLMGLHNNIMFYLLSKEKLFTNKNKYFIVLINK